MVPRGIDKDPRLAPWLNQHDVNGREIIWAVERIMDKLSRKPKELFLVSELLEGLSHRHLPYRLLKEIVTTSGLFHLEDIYVKYDWERFAQNPTVNSQAAEDKTEETEGESPAQARHNDGTDPAHTHARTSSSANRRVQYTETETEKENISHTKKEKEKKREDAAVETAAQVAAKAAVAAVLNAPPKAPAGDDYEARIHDIVQHYPFRKGELVGWGGKTEEMNRERLEKCLIGLLNDRYSSMAQKVGRYLKQKDYLERWRDIVMAYVVQLDGTGTMSRLANVSEVRHYFFALSKQNDVKSRAYQAGLCMAEELEEKHQARMAVEKQRFPFEDYDPERGTRYVGNDLIPWDAPPRPDAVSTWDEEDRCWRSPAEVEERAQRSHARFIEMLKTYNESHGKPGGAELPG